MRMIKITRRNMDNIEAAMASANGKASAFTVSDYASAENAARLADNALALLPIRERTGATAIYAPDYSAANAYRNSALTTELHLVRRASGWFLADVRKVRVWPKRSGCSERCFVSVSQAQKDEIARRAVAHLNVAPNCRWHRW